MKTTRRQAAIFFTLLLFPAAIFAAGPPDWVTRGVEAAYPQELYIAVTGRGKTRERAKTDALTELSNYFEARVEAVVLDYESTVIENNREQYRGVFDAKSLVSSQANLFAVRYAAPYFDKARKLYVTAAYIDREEAWRIFRPRVLREADGFRALWRGAENEKDVLTAFFAWKAAAAYALREEFVNALLFGETLYSAKMKEFEDVQKNYSGLAAVLQRARNTAQIFIDCPKDFEAALQNTFAGILGAEGLIVTKKKNAARAFCTVAVTEGYVNQSGAGYFYYPKISVELGGRQGKALFSFAADPGKQGAITAEVAKRRAYNALAAEVKNAFADELHKVLGVE